MHPDQRVIRLVDDLEEIENVEIVANTGNILRDGVYFDPEDEKYYMYITPSDSEEEEIIKINFPCENTESGICLGVDKCPLYPSRGCYCIRCDEFYFCNGNCKRIAD